MTTRKLIDQSSEYMALFRAIGIFSEVYNFEHYNLKGERLKNRIIDCIVAIWSVKDWVKEMDGFDPKQVELEINKMKYLPIIADLANTAKHKILKQKPRSGIGAKSTDYFGRLSKLDGTTIREMWYIDDGRGKVVEIFEILRESLDEWEEIIWKLKGGG